MNKILLNKQLSNIGCYLLSILPILSYIRFLEMGNISLGYVLALVLTVLILYKSGVSISTNRLIPIIYCVFFIFFWILSTINGIEGIGVVVFNIIIYLVYIGLCERTAVCVFTVLNGITTVSIVASLILILQYIMHYFFNSYLQIIPISWYIESLRTSSASIERITTGMASGEFRPAAFFNEPAHFAQYVSVALAYILYKYLKEKNKRLLFLAIGISLCLIMSTSSLGFITVFLLWILFFLDNIKRHRINLSFLLIFFFALCIILISLKQDFFRVIVDRLFMSGTSVSGRSGGYVAFLDLSLFSKLFGVGMGREPREGVYFTSASVSLYRVGIVGTVLFLMSLCFKRKYKNVFSVWITALFFVIYLSAGIYDFVSMFFYSTVVFADLKEVNGYN